MLKEENFNLKNLSYEIAKNRSEKHHNLFHYTRYDALKCIIQNRSLRLSRVDLLNDTVENNKIIDLWKNKVFVVCFTYHRYESPFFWKMYSKGSNEGVRISFSRDFLKDLTIHSDDKCATAPLKPCKRTEFNVPHSLQVNSKSWGIFDYTILDVMYADRNQKIGYDENTQGRIKYHEWDLEKETRLRVAVRPKFDEVKLNRRYQIEYIPPENEYLYAKLPEECLRSMTVTLSPVADDGLKENIEQLLKDNNLIDFVKINTSSLHGEIKE